VKARKVKKLDPAGILAENAGRIVLVRIDELRGVATDALEPGASATQHDMRIAAKRLRYVLEATGFCFGRAAKTARQRAEDLQDLLGEVHDCDVMLPRVIDHRRSLRHADAEVVRARAGDDPDLDPKLAARAPHRTSYRGLDVLEVYLRARRSLLFNRFVELWAEQERTGTWTRLERAVKQHLRVKKEQRRARRFDLPQSSTADSR
jgi:hypothetical protein